MSPSAPSVFTRNSVKAFISGEHTARSTGEYLIITKRDITVTVSPASLKISEKSAVISDNILVKLLHGLSPSDQVRQSFSEPACNLDSQVWALWKRDGSSVHEKVNSHLTIQAISMRFSPFCRYQLSKL